MSAVMPCPQIGAYHPATFHGAFIKNPQNAEPQMRFPGQDYPAKAAALEPPPGPFMTASTAKQIFKPPRLGRGNIPCAAQSDREIAVNASSRRISIVC